MKSRFSFYRIAAALILLSGGIDVSAFQSKQIVTMVAGTVVGALPDMPLKIGHTPLSGGSPVSKEALILGEVGSEIHPVPPPYEARLTPQSDFGPAANHMIRIRVIYRFSHGTPGQASQQDLTASTAELPPIEGVDPTAFAFQITPGAVDTGVLQYRIVAVRLDGAGAPQPGTEVLSPPATPDDAEPFWTVNVQANAAEVIGPQGGRVTVKDGNPLDGETTLDVPAGILTTPTRVTLDEVPLSGAPGGLSVSGLTVPPGLVQPIRVYRVESDPPVNGVFQLSLLYPDFVFPAGQDGLVDNTNFQENATAILWWDGFKWRRIGGSNNPRLNTLSVKIGSFGYMAVVPAAPIAPQDRRPLEKVITPNGDGKNDDVTFALGDLAQNVNVDIYDTTGRRVRTIHSALTLQWNGRDDNGEVVESGVYIYQYEVDGQRVSGLVAVAK